jgi:hypothetical protein
MCEDRVSRDEDEIYELTDFIWPRCGIVSENHQQHRHEDVSDVTAGIDLGFHSVAGNKCRAAAWGSSSCLANAGVL